MNELLGVKDSADAGKAKANFAGRGFLMWDALQARGATSIYRAFLRQFTLR